MGFFQHRRCPECHTDYELNIFSVHLKGISDSKDRVVMISTRWMNLGQGGRQDDIQWMMNSMESPPSRLADGPYHPDESPMKAFEATCSENGPPKSIGLQSEALACLRDGKYEEWEEQDFWEPLNEPSWIES
jgi:hypothetical protein